MAPELILCSVCRCLLDKDKKGGILRFGEDIPDGPIAKSFASLHVGYDVESKAGGVEANCNGLEDGMVARQNGTLMAERSCPGKGDESADKGLGKIGVNDGAVPEPFFCLHFRVLWVIITTGSVVTILSSCQFVAGPTSNAGEEQLLGTGLHAQDLLEGKTIVIPPATDSRPPGREELCGREGDVLGCDSVGCTADTVGYNGDSSIEGKGWEEGVLFCVRPQDSYLGNLTMVVQGQV